MFSNQRKGIQRKFNPRLSFFTVHCFNSQEKQLKAGRGLTYTQWSKIDERHPAWTNHSTEGEASQQTWKVQEAMTGLMVWKMLLMNEEKRLWLCLYPLLFTLLLGTKLTWVWYSSFLLDNMAWRVVRWIDGFTGPYEYHILLLYTLIHHHKWKTYLPSPGNTKANWQLLLQKLSPTVI